MVRRVAGGSWPPMILTAIGLALILHSHDIAVRDMWTFALYLALAISLPGVFCWRLLLGNWHRVADLRAPQPGSGRPLAEPTGAADIESGGETVDGTLDNADESPAEREDGDLDDQDDAASAGRRPTWFEDLSLGTIFGFGIQLPVYLLGVWIDVPRLFLVVPVIVLVLSVAAPFGRRVWTMPTDRVDARVSWSLGVVVLYAVAWLARYVLVLRPLTLPPYKTPSVDETFHQSLIAELSHRFPPEIPFLLGTKLDYHWFVHAQIAADQWATGLDPVLMLRDLMPVGMLVLTILGLGAAALRLSGRGLAAFIAPALLVAGAFSLTGPHYFAAGFTEPFLSRRYLSSPSQAYGFMMAIPAIMLILEVLRADRRASKSTWVALVLALLALSGSKATFMPIFLCGALVLLVLQLVLRRTLDRSVALLAGLLLAVTIFAQVVLFGSTSGGLRVAFFLTSKAALRNEHIPMNATTQTVMTVSLLVSWLLYGAGVAGLIRGRLWSDRRTVWMTFSVLAGVSVAFVFFRSGLSQLWFQRSVAPLVVLASAWGLAVLLPKLVTKRYAALLALTAAASGAAIYVIGRYAERGNKTPANATYHELLGTVLLPVAVIALYLLVKLATRIGRGAATSSALVVAVLLGFSLSHVYAFGFDTVTNAPEPDRTPLNQFAPGGVQAATWILDHSNRYDVVATNVHCRKPGDQRCDNRNFWVSAYTERRIVIEGWGYTQVTNDSYTDEPSNADIPAPYPRRLKINDAAFTHPTAKSVKRLVDAYDVKFLFVGKRYPADLKALNQLPDLLKRTFASPNYAVFQVLPGAPGP